MVAAITPSRPRLRLRLAGIALIVILALAAALRLIGLRFGLPAVYNPDEVAIMTRALAFAKGDLNPHNFLYPTFYFYVLFAWIGATFVVSWLTGAVASLAAFQTLFFTDPTLIYTAGRLLGVICGTVTVAFTYVVGTRLHYRATGLMAALFLAVAPGHVRDSHYVKHDVPATLAIVIAQLAILRLLQRDDQQRATASAGASANVDSGAGAWRPFALAGAACGVACSTHYYAVFLAFPLLLAIYFATHARGAPWRTMLTRTAQAGAAAAIVFFALSPFLLVEPATAIRDIVANRQIVVDRAVTAQHALFGNLGVYARMLWSEANGWPVCLTALAGAVLMLRERESRPRQAAMIRDGQPTQHRATRSAALVLLAFGIPFLLFISNTVVASRYLNPVLPTCAWLAAYAVSRISERIPIRSARPSPRPSPSPTPARPEAAAAVMAVIALAMSLPGLARSARLDTFFRQPDTRTLAQQFIERTVPPGATILLQPYSVPLTQSRDSLLEALQAHLGDLRRTPPPPKFAMRLALTPYPSPAYRTIYLGEGGLDQDKIYLSYHDTDTSDEALRHAGVQFIVLKRYNVPDPAVEPLRERLAKTARLLATFSPYKAGADASTRARVAPFLHNTDTPDDPALERPGPGIEVWQVQ